MPEALPSNSSENDLKQTEQVELNQVELEETDEQNLQILYPPSDTQQSTNEASDAHQDTPYPENNHEGDDSSSLASLTPPSINNTDSPPDFKTAAQYKTLSNENEHNHQKTPPPDAQVSPCTETNKYTNSAFDQTQSLQNTTPSSESKQHTSSSRTRILSTSSSLPNLTTNQRVGVLVLLFALNMCCYMDRSTIMALQNDVKKAFCLGDKEAGLLSTAFTFPYMFASLAAGVMGDRLNRKTVILLGSTIWVSSVVLGSFVTTDQPFQLYQELHVNATKDQRTTWFPKAQLRKIDSQYKLLQGGFAKVSRKFSKVEKRLKNTRIDIFRPKLT